MRTFIVPTDFSVNADNASAYAVQLAAQLEARVILMHAYQAPVAISEYELSTIHFDTMKEHILKRLAEKREALRARFGEQVPMECLAFNNDLIEHLKGLYAQREASLAIIGLTGSGMANFFLGGNTLNIVNQLGRMVLTIPPYATYRPVRKIVFACDMQDVATTVPVRRIGRLLGILDAELLVLNIQHPRQPSARLNAEREALNQVMAGIPFAFHCITKRNIVAGIKDFVREQKADLIAIVPKQRDFLESLLRPNHTKEMLFRSGVPILTIPPDEQ